MDKKIKEQDQIYVHHLDVKSEDGTLITEEQEIRERWTEYTEELFHDDRQEKPVIRKNMEGPKIKESEVKEAIRKTKRNKAAGPDEITTEMIVALDDFGIEKMTQVANQIYDSGTIPEDLSKSIFVALYLKSLVQLSANFTAQSVWWAMSLRSF